jgi:Bacterial protein of unknown function (HtrL_YibB)
MTNPVTIVTAFFDIGREHRGDGRSVEEYKEWLKLTLQLNCKIYIVTEEKFRDFFMEHRPAHYATSLKIIDFKDSYYYKYRDAMKTILDDPVYQSKIADPNRVECLLPEYNIIQYSKFHYLQMAIEENPFQSSSFFWMDAGCSRFFMDVNVSVPYPSPVIHEFLKQNPDKFVIQKRHDLEYYPIDDEFVWKSANLLSGGMFGGGKDMVLKIAELVETVFLEKMLAKKNVNNEQLALAMVWKEYPDYFTLVDNVYRQHFSLFKLMSL